jgi:CspA family cold shock protein
MPVRPPAVEQAAAHAAARSYGVVKWFSAAKAYGFLRADDGRDVFVHVTGFGEEMPDEPGPGFRVSYELEAGRRGWQAVNVRPA